MNYHLRMTKNNLTVVLMTVMLSLSAFDCVAEPQQSVDVERQEMVLRIDQLSRAIESRTLTTASLAEALRSRGVLFSDMDANEQALRDFNAALALDPDDAESYNSRGVVYHKEKEYDLARADFDLSIRLAPDRAYPYYSRAHLHYYQGRFAEAQDDLESGLSLAAPADEPYGMVWLFATMVQQGDENAGTVLRDYLARQESRTWPMPLLQLFTGELSPEEVLAAATAPEASKDREQKCEANFYLGLWHQFRGERELARDAFQQAVNSNVKKFIEYQFGRVELERLSEP